MQDTIDDLGGLAADDELRSLIAGSRAPAKDPSWADMGFSRLTDSDLDWADAQLDRPVGVAEGFTPEWGDVPLGGYGYTLQRLLDVKQSLARMQTGKGELEDEQEVMRWMVNEARAKTPSGTVGELFRGMATFGAEFLVSGGVASAAKGASKKALSSLLKQSIEEGAEKAAVGFLGKAGTTLALQEVPHQIAGAAGFGPGGGAITAQAVQSVMGREMTLEEAESVAEDWRAGLPLLLGMAGDDIEGRFGTPELGTVGGMINGLLRQGIEVGVEGAGGALSKLPVVKQFDTLMGGLFKTLEGRAGKVGWGQAIREAAELSGGGGEAAEEYLASVTSALVMGDQSVEEAVAEVADITPEMLVAFSILPGAQAAAGRFAGPTLQDQIDLMEKQAASAGPAEGGDPVSTDTPEGVTPSPASEGVSTPSPEQREMDVQAFAADIKREAGREVEFKQVEAETPAQKMAQRALRRRGIDPTFVRSENSEGLPAAYYPGEGRAVVRADGPDVLGAAVHEAIHTWAAQQEDTAAAVKQELDALRGKDAEFIGRMREYWAENQIVAAPSAELEAEEVVAVTAQATAEIIAYLDTPMGMQDFATVYENNPSGFKATLKAVYEWVASKIRLLPSTQRMQAQQRLDIARGNLPTSSIEIAQQLRGLLDSIEPVKVAPVEGAPSQAVQGGLFTEGAAQGVIPAREVEMPPLRGQEAAEPEVDPEPREVVGNTLLPGDRVQVMQRSENGATRMIEATVLRWVGGDRTRLRVRYDTGTFDNAAGNRGRRRDAEREFPRGQLRLVARGTPEPGSLREKLRVRAVEELRAEQEPRFAPAAWHGTPHEVDKFSTSKIGTGEGAQAYGYGLYFAEKRDVAEYYRDFLGQTNRDVYIDGQRAFSNADFSETATNRAAYMIAVNGDVEGALQAHKELQESLNYPAHLEPVADEIRALDGRVEVRTRRTGKLYQVELAPKDDEWLLWDEPLSAQSEKVRGALLGFDDPGAKKRLDTAYAKFHALSDSESSDVMSLLETTPEQEAAWAEAQQAQQAYDRSLGGILGNRDSSLHQITGADAYRRLANAGNDTRGGAGDQVGASAALHAVGIRGIKYLDGSSRSKGEGAYNYVVFDEADIEITGRFAPPIDDDTRQRLEDKGLAAPLNVTASFLDDAQIISRWDKFQRAVSDEFLAVKKYVDAVSNLGGDTEANPLIAARSYWGRMSQRVRVLQNDHFKPLWEAMRKAGINAEVAGEYLEVRHVEERNEHFHKQYQERESLKRQKRRAKDEADKKRLQRQIDKLDHVRVRLAPGTDSRQHFHEISPGAGMKTSEAVERMAEMEKAHPEISGLGRKIDRLNRQVRKGMVADGLLSQEQADRWEDQFKHYVPLRTAEVDRPEFPRSGGLQVRGPETKQAKGRKSRADNPMVMSIVQAVNSAQRGEKNKVGQEFSDFLEANGDLLENVTREVELDADGAPQLAEQEFYFKRDGKDVAIKIQNEDLVNGLKRLNIQHLPSWTKAYTAYMRVWRSLVTSWNPPFIITNALRDYQTALINASSLAKQYGISGLRSSMTRRYLSSFNAVRSYLRKGNDSTHPKRDRLIEYYEAGGPSGLYASPVFQEQKRDIEKQTDRATGSAVRRGATEILDFIEDYNQAVEAAARFSLYDTLRDKGVSAKEAANAARELTVDFSQKGELGPVISAIYAFFSASVGGTRRMVQEIARSKVARGMVAGLIANGFLSVYYNDWLSDDDDDGLSFYSKVPEYEKSKYQMLMLPGDEPIKFIMPWGYAFFHNLGRLGAEYVRGEKTMGQAGVHAAGALLDNYMPIGGGGTPLQMVTPTIGRPIVEVSQNTNFAGNPIAPPINPFGPETARYTKSGRSTHPAAITVARWINSATGGDEIDPGAINLAGDHVEHLYDFAVGGLGRTVSDVAKTWRSVGDYREGQMSMEDVLKQAPFVKVVYGARTEFVDSENFYNALEDIQRSEMRIKAAQEAGDRDLLRELRERYGPTIRLKKRGNRIRSKAADLRGEAYEDGKIVRPEKLEESTRMMREWYRDYLIATTTGGRGGSGVR